MPERLAERQRHTQRRAHRDRALRCTQLGGQRVQLNDVPGSTIAEQHTDRERDDHGVRRILSHPSVRRARHDVHRTLAPGDPDDARIERHATRRQPRGKRLHQHRVAAGEPVLAARGARLLTAVLRLHDRLRTRAPRIGSVIAFHVLPGAQPVALVHTVHIVEHRAERPVRWHPQCDAGDHVTDAIEQRIVARQHALVGTPVRTADLQQLYARTVDELAQLIRQVVDELRAQLDGYAEPVGIQRVHATAHPRPRLEHQHAHARVMQLCRSGQPRRTGANDQHVAIHGRCSVQNP